jgi:cell division protein FtsI/penicillin-binding protein 2
VAAAVVGVVGFEHSGLSGMEHRLDQALLSTAGRLVFLRDAHSRPLWIEPADYRPGRDGADVRLSIDLVIQDMAEKRLRDAVEDVNAGGGRIVVMDCRTGEVLAMHDILNPRPGWDEQTHDEARKRNPGLGRNRIFTDPYEPGSTFKPFIWSIATKHGLAHPDEVLPTPTGHAYLTGYGRRIRDAHYHGPSTWRDVLVQSMNSGMAIVAERMTHRMMQDAIRAFGFGGRSGSGMPGESRGIVTSAKAWTDYTQSSVAMGHEIAVTPIQMVRAFSAFARDGTIPTPRFTAITAVTAEGVAPRFLHQAVPPALATTTRRILRDVMREGTGRRAQSALYSMFGKSGTAQLAKADGGGYHEDRYVSSFIAGAPYRDPRLVVLCIIDDPDRAKGHYGGAIAGPAVRDVIDGTLAYLGVEPDL